jgi:hypothetical protein
MRDLTQKALDRIEAGPSCRTVASACKVQTQGLTPSAPLGFVALDGFLEVLGLVVDSGARLGFCSTQALPCDGRQGLSRRWHGGIFTSEA